MPDPNKPYFEIVGYSEKSIKDKEVIFSFDENGDGKLNFSLALISKKGIF